MFSCCCLCFIYLLYFHSSWVRQLFCDPLILLYMHSFFLILCLLFANFSYYSTFCSFFLIFSTTRKSPILGLCTRMWIPFLFSPLNPPFLILHLKLPLVFPLLHVASLNLDFTSSLSRILGSHSLL